MINILIIDDDKSRNNKIFNYLTKSQDYIKLINIDQAFCADQGRVYLKQKRYDLVILDAVLPKKIGSVPDVQVSYKLLTELDNPVYFNIPDIIIGITAHLEQAHDFKEFYSKNTTLLIEASIYSDEWLDTIEMRVNTILNKKLFENKQKEYVLIPIHGIRTYAKWQRIFTATVLSKSKNINVSPIKYGYFDIFSFCIPYLRKKKILAVSNNLRNLIIEEHEQNKKIVVVAHSFGTFISHHAINNLPPNISIELIIFSGSPLSRNIDLSGVINKTKLLLNECGHKDYVVVLASLFIYGAGDAGRAGFNNNSKKLINRFYEGGHSVYFERKDIFDQQWADIIFSKLEKPNIQDIEHSQLCIDERKNTNIDDIREFLITYLPLFTKVSLPIILLYVFYSIFSNMIIR